MKIDETLAPDSLAPKIRRLWRLSAPKILAIERTCEPSRGAPVFTVDGVYTSRGWTEWTQGFQYGSALLQFEATRDPEFLAIGRDNTLRKVLPHATHMGVHDHGFNIVSTYGALLRMMLEGTLPPEAWERACYETALKCSAAVQARRWTRLPDGGGFIYSFNGPHSLFADTIRSLRSLALGHLLGHVLLEEHDERVSLLERLLRHAAATARYNVYYGKGRDAYDVRGRVAHESIFNLNDGRYRCPSSQQGFSPFSTWTRGLAWIMCGYAEELEFLATLSEEEFAAWGGRAAVEGWCRAAAEAACDFYIEHTAADGIPYWDTGAPHLGALGDWRGRPADPFNDHEPVDSSAAAIAAQGLLRLGRFLGARNEPKGSTYWQAGLTVLDTLFDEPYLAADPRHQGLILHSVYHRPNGWDHIPEGRRVPCGEASMWGDYHAWEAALYLQRLCRGEPYLTFFSKPPGGAREAQT